MKAPSLTILEGDCIEQLKTLPDESVHCVVTSPPYWGLRDYGVKGQIGLEKTPEEYVAKMVAVFREVRRVLRGDGTCWVDLGDSYACTPVGSFNGGGACLAGRDLSGHSEGSKRNKAKDSGLKPKDLVGVPWRVAFALQANGWWLRSEIIWHKPNPMPESVTDRPTKSHEQVFLLAKSSSYFYDAEAIKEPSETEPHAPGWSTQRPTDSGPMERRKADGSSASQWDEPNRVWGNGTRNKRSVWTIPSQAYSEAHFATFPEALVKPCILAGTSARGCCPKCGAPWERVVEKTGGTIGKSWHDHGNDLGKGQSGQINYCLKTAGNSDYKVETTGWKLTCVCGEQRDGWLVPFDPVPCTVLDPFGGSFTTCQVALELGRNAVGIELNPEYVKLARARCAVTLGLALA